jgi:hypothetical protein
MLMFMKGNSHLISINLNDLISFFFYFCGKNFFLVDDNSGLSAFGVSPLKRNKFL